MGGMKTGRARGGWVGSAHARSGSLPHLFQPSPAAGADPAGARVRGGSTWGLSISSSATGNPMSLLQQHSPGSDGVLIQPAVAPVVKQGRMPFLPGSI